MNDIMLWKATSRLVCLDDYENLNRFLKHFTAEIGLSLATTDCISYKLHSWVFGSKAVSYLSCFIGPPKDSFPSQIKVKKMYVLPVI